MGVNVKSLGNLTHGVKSKAWVNTPTIAIRIPEKYKDLVLDYTHLLDQNTEEDNRTVQVISSPDIINSLRLIVEKVNKKETGFRKNSASQLIGEIKLLLQLLEGE